MKPFTRTGIISIGLISAALLSGCGSGSLPPPPPPILVSISPATAVVEINSSRDFTATVANDSSGKGVTWSLSGLNCTEFDCGSLSSTTGNTVTYTAPQFYPVTVLLQGTSMADSTKSATATVMVTLPISVSVAPFWSSVAPGGVQRFVAPVTNDPTFSGVTWTLSQSGAPCSPACGTISPESTTGAALATYTAPSTIPDPPQVTTTATSITNPIRSGSATLSLASGGNNNAKLNGRYAFLLGTFIGSLAADGQGGISGVAVLDSQKGPIPVSGAYAIDSNGRGALALANESGTLANIPLDLPPTSIGDTSLSSLDDIEVPSGIIKRQDTTAFSTPKIVGDYAFGFFGSACGRGFCSRRFDVGKFHADGAGNLTREGTNGGSYSVSNSTTGYGTAMLPNSSGGTDPFAFYVVTATELFFKFDETTGAGYGTSLRGQVLQQQTPPDGFSNESLNSLSVIRETGGRGVFNIGPFQASVLAGLLNADGRGNFTLTDDKNDAGTITSETVTGTYSVASDGGVTMTGGKNLTMYLVSPNQGFVLDRDINALGFLQPQTATSVVGSFAYNTMIGEGPGKLQSGMATLGANGDITLDISNGGDPSTFQTFTGTYTIGPDGRGTITITSPSAKTLPMYVISPTRFVAVDSVDAGDVTPAILEFSR